MVVEDNNRSTGKKACVLCNREFTSDTSFCPHDGALLAPVPCKTSPGTVISQRYEVLQGIGDGGMGQVYKARDKTLKRDVAIKMLLPSLTASPGALLRFQQEAQSVSALNHPNIVGIHDFGVTANGEPFIVLDFISGISLGAELERVGYLDQERACKIFYQICSGLLHAHQAGIIHRDLKPGNILLTDLDGDPDFVKLIDFGIAKLLREDDTSPELTKTGDIFGSAEFMSPEQCRGQKLDIRSDIYSLGCVMYKALTGRLPFSGNDRDELLYKHVHEAPCRFSDAGESTSIDPALESLVFKALQKDPDDRYQTMFEVKEALREADPNSTQRQPIVQTSVTSPQFQIAEANQPTRTGRTPSALIAAVALVSLTALSILVYVSSKSINKPFTSSKPLSKGALRQADKKYDDLMRKAWDYWDKGDYVNTLLNAREAEKRAEALGSDDPRVAKAVYMQGLCDWATGEYHSSYKQLDEALNLTKKGSGPDTLDYAEVETALGVVLSDLGKFKDAEHSIREGMKTRKQLAGPDSPELADSAAALGYMYEKNEKFPQAIKQLTEALYIVQRSGKDPDQDIEYFMVSLADAYRQAEQYSTAELLYIRALSMNLGPYRVQAESGLATNFFKQKKYQEAAHHAKLAEELYDRQLGPLNLKSPEMRKLREDAEQAAKVPSRH